MAVHYQRIARQSEAMKRLAAHARRVIPGSAHHVPLATVRALGGGDIGTGEDILGRMFKMAAPRAIHPDALRELGNGSVTAGRKVLQRFLDRAGTHPAPDSELPEAEHEARGGKVKYFYERVPPAKIVWQPDGNHGRPL